MGLSAATLTAVEEARASVEAFYDRSLEEVDEQVELLRGYDVSISKVSELTTEVAADAAMQTIQALLV